MSDLPFLLGDWQRLAAVCRQRRVNLGMPLATFSERMGMSLRAALQFEAGASVSLETLVLIEQAFGWCLGDTLRVLRNEINYVTVDG